MIRNIYILLLLSLSYSVGYAQSGCTDPEACNYDETATADDGSCYYINDLYLGFNQNQFTIDGGVWHVLAITDSNGIVGWGANSDGQSEPPENLTDVISVAAGFYHSLALTSDGEVVAWGYNNHGQTDVPSNLSNVVAISARSAYSLALNSYGEVIAWGNNAWGQIDVPEGLTNAISISAGFSHALALVSSGEVVGWGENVYGQIDIPEGLNNVISISSGHGHSLALLSSGQVVAWGANNYGQSDVPEGLNEVVAIEAGLYHSLALLSSGEVVAWGNNVKGQVDVPEGLTDVVAISSIGSNYSLAITVSGDVVVWGWLDYEWYNLGDIPDGYVAPIYQDACDCDGNVVDCAGECGGDGSNCSNVAVELSIVNLDELHRTFDIVYTSSVDIYGFELDIVGVNVEDYEHNLNGEVYMNNNHFLGLSFTQDVLFPAAIDGELMSITYELSSENTSICLSNGLFGGVADGVISAYYAEETCNDLNWSGIGIDFGEISTDMDDTTRTLEINYESLVDIHGFQMTLDGITLLDVENEYFDIIYSNNTGVIVGFNISGEVLPAGQGTLLTISFAGENSPAGETNLCITAATFATYDGLEAIPVDYEFLNGNCLDIDAIWYDCNNDPAGNSVIDSCGLCSGGNSGHEADSDQDDCGVCFGSNEAASGDINVDSLLDVNDIVLMVTHVIDDSYTFDSCGLIVGDVNSDSIVNILDIIVVVETIVYGDLARTSAILGAAPSTLELIQHSNSLGYVTDKPGLIGFELILSHENDFSIALNEESFIADYNTSGNETKIIMVLEGGSELFTTTDKYEIEDMTIGTTMGELLDVSVTIIPDEYTLERAYPNPFNPTTTLSFAIPVESNVSLSIYNLQGREVSMLIEGNMDAGYHSVVWNANPYASGVYFVKMVAGEYINTQKLMLVK